MNRDGFVSVRIQLGENISKSYLVAQVTSPQCYDGFGTITLRDEWGEIEGKPFRLVLIEAENFDWQVTRYSSGLGLTQPAEYVSESDVAKELYRRLVEGSLR